MFGRFLSKPGEQEVTPGSSPQMDSERRWVISWLSLKLSFHKAALAATAAMHMVSERRCCWILDIETSDSKNKRYKTQPASTIIYMHHIYIYI